MASTVACTLGWGSSDGETIDSPGTRWSTVARPMVAGGATPLAVRGGIVPSGGDPLGVTQAGTPAMKVTVKAGTCVIPGNSSSTAQVALTLLANTDLDIAAAHATLPRIDLVCARVNSPGTSSAFAQIEVITGTANASPTRPTINNSGNDHSIVLKTVAVAAAATTIVNANLTTNAATDAQTMVAPGGVVPVTAYNTRLSGGVDLIDYQPFFSIADRMPGVMLPSTGAALWGPMARYFTGVVSTNASGDANANIGLYLSGGFVAAPFPNAILAASITDTTPIGSFPGVTDIKWTAASSTNANVTFRVTNGEGTALVSTSVEVSIVAFGR